MAALAVKAIPPASKINTDTPTTAYGLPPPIITNLTEQDDAKSIMSPTVATQLADLKDLLVNVCDAVNAILRKNKDATQLLKQLNAVKDAFLANLASLSHHVSMPPTQPPTRPASPTKSIRSHNLHMLNHPMSPDEVDSISVLAHWVNEFRSAVVSLNDRIMKVKSANLMTISAKKKKLEKGVGEVADAWNNLMMNLSIAIARTGTTFAVNATENVAKLALASGNPDWDDLVLDDAEVLVLQGDKFILGFGVRKDPQTAYRRYEAAASHPQALTMLGLMNEMGIGRPAKDLAAAASFYQQAADRGDAVALTALGRLYESGQGVDVNLGKARECYQRAAEKGDPDGMASLGMVLERGIGDLHPNPASALRWYTLAAQQFNHARSATAAGCLLYKGQGLDVAVNQVQAVKFFRQAAALGNEHAMNSLGVAYEEGCGVAKDLGLAKEWYLRASEGGSASAMANLGNMYLTEKNYEQAFRVFQLAWSMGCVEGAYGLGQMYQQGCKEGALGKLYLKPLFNNPTAALPLIAEAASQIPEAMELVGHLYETGTGCANEMIDEAVKWYKRAIEANEKHGKAMVRLGMLMERGHGVQKELGRAADLYEEAGKRGNVEALERLEALKRVGLL
ncbi:hypothetical protein SeMB42_g05968 [Synchytrium endobioticum]|uniref:Uncharacterized protein n=1 Tax=Synchytrium endobioticum TaxID=286115 RepID=A0A507CN05_9FUNG|nr:hypothetical protein SeMB42_g05968 [Synchytrium endobioticum]